MKEIVNTPETEIHEPCENKSKKKKKKNQQHCMRGIKGVVQMSLK